MPNVILKIRQELKKNSDKKTQESSQRFFKQKIVCYGVKSAVVGRIGKQFFREIKDLKKAEIFALCEELWSSGFMEESFIACNWSHAVAKDYETKDFKVFEKWIDAYITNWASCDTFCNHTMGAFIDMYPQYLTELKRWARSKNLWLRRAAAVSLIIPAKRGRYLADVLEIADILLLDCEDMVQKGYGWMLKVASQAHEKAVFDYVMKNRAVMPRTALRYAIEKMPKELKMKAMAKE